MNKWKIARWIKYQKLRSQKNNSSGAADDGNNKNKESKQKKKYQQIDTNFSVNKNLSMKCTYCGQDGHFAIKCFKTIKGRATKLIQLVWLVVKKCQIIYMRNL